MKKFYCLVASLSVILLSLELNAQSITRGPYLQMGTPSSMVIKWRTSTATSSQVWYGTSPSNLNFTTTENGSRTDHEVTVSGLPANTTFYYAVGNTSGQLMTPTNNHYFKTSPTPGSTQRIRVWVLGDAGKATQNQRDVRDAFYNFNGSEHIDLILLLGDNAYEEGTDAQHQVALFENMYEDKLIQTPMYPTMGNHDSKSSVSATQTGPYFEIFTMPTNGEAGGVPSGTEAYYSFDYGNIHFIVLDSDDTPLDLNTPMYNWLIADISSTNQQWKVVFFHHPPYTETDSDSAEKETAMRENYLPVLEAHGIDLVLVGHAHNYERSYLIKGHYDVSSTFNPATMALDLGDGDPDGDGAYQKTGDEGTVYVVSGSAGSSAGALSNEHPAMHTSLGEKGSFYFEVTGHQMDLTFIRENGLIQDEFSISKQMIVGVPPTVSVTAPADGTHYDTPQAVTITANASDSDGSVTQVQFLVDGSSIGIDNQAPYAINYTPPGNGTYDIQAIATDNDDNTIQSAVVHFAVGPITTCARIAAESDDAEEDASGSVSASSSDLEMAEDSENQIIGLRFNNLDIPPGATITEAHLQFTVDETTNISPCNLAITGQTGTDPLTFSSSDNDISSRTRTGASVSWVPADWLATGDAGPAQRTPDLSAVIQEIINHNNYSGSHSIALFIEGIGKRTAESYDGEPAGAPELCVQYSLTPPDCPMLSANIGDPCDDGDNTTINDSVDANCACNGTATACTNIGDDDGDGICADVDCDDSDPNITHQPGDACDDGNAGTINDVYDANCYCTGTLNDCPGIGDNDGDGICSDVDCNDNDPNSSAQPGDACDDGDNTTVDDVYDSNCMCNGTPTACTNIGDADGDGVCSDVDCDDNDANNTAQPGDACDDGDNTTTGETIQPNCSCGGGTPVPTFTCVRVSAGDDDGEERNGGSVNLNSSDLELVVDGNKGAQTIGMRFTGLNIPQGAVIAAAYLQFTADENNNTNPCNLVIFGEATDNASTFSNSDNNISGRVRTNATVGWSPSDWLVVSEAEQAQQTPDIAPVLQEIVNRQGYTANSSIVLLIEGTGARTAESYDGEPTLAPQLCVSFTTVQYDCPSRSANIGDTCDDGDNTTLNDIVDANCNCVGTSTACTGIGDDDSDGICADVDCDDTNASIGSNANDMDCDGVPANMDCDDNNASLGSTANDADCDGVPANEDCDDNNAAIGSNANDMDCDGVPSTQDCDDNDPNIGMNTNDMDCDGVAGNIDCDDTDPNITTTTSEDADCDGVPTAQDCDDTNAALGSTANDMDCDGVLTAQDCDDNNASIGSNDNDMDCDGIPTTSDCDDNNPAIGSNANDMDCDGIPTAQDCDDTNPSIGSSANDMDCDGVPAGVDCDDTNAAINYQPGDACNDSNPNTFGETIQSDCSCGGGTSMPSSVCSTISNSTDDAEEEVVGGKMDVNSSDLELTFDRESQWVGLRFNNLNIPQGANIISAYIQFVVDENSNEDPSSLTIYGQATDNAATFSETDFDISSRFRTTNSVAWAPAQWLTVGEAGPAQQTPDLSALIQEIVNRSNYTSGSSIALIIEGTGQRVAESVDGSAGPQLCIEYFDTPPNYDCPALSAYIGDDCDDGDNTTINDTVDGDCNCAGTPTACTGIGDMDGDGICTNADCDDNDASVTTQAGDACDDGDPATINDMLDVNCNCAGTLNDCPGTGDMDGDGICSDVDCDDDDANNTFREGDDCDDGNPNTVGETIQADCSCGGGTSTPTQTCAMVNANSDDAEQELTGTVDVGSSDLELMIDSRHGQQVIGLRFNGLNIPQGAVITSAYLQFTVDEADNENPCDLTIQGQAADNAATFVETDFDVSGRSRTNAAVNWSPPEWQSVGASGPEQQTPDLSPVIQEIIDRMGYTNGSSIALIIEGIGKRTAESYNGSINGAPELCVEYLYATQSGNLNPGSTTTVLEGKTAVERNKATSIQVYPNPARDRLLVKFNSTEDGEVQLQVHRSSGQEVINITRVVSKGENSILLDGLSLPNGIYFLQLFTKGGVQSAKFVIAKE